MRLFFVKYLFSTRLFLTWIWFIRIFLSSDLFRWIFRISFLILNLVAVDASMSRVESASLIGCFTLSYSAAHACLALVCRVISTFGVARLAPLILFLLAQLLISILWLGEVWRSAMYISNHNPYFTILDSLISYAAVCVILYTPCTIYVYSFTVLYVSCTGYYCDPFVIRMIRV
jgi:hypothetical protein